MELSSYAIWKTTVQCASYESKLAVQVAFLISLSVEWVSLRPQSRVWWFFLYICHMEKWLLKQSMTTLLKPIASARCQTSYLAIVLLIALLESARVGRTSPATQDVCVKQCHRSKTLDLWLANPARTTPLIVYWNAVVVPASPQQTSNPPSYNGTDNMQASVLLTIDTSALQALADTAMGWQLENCRDLEDPMKWLDEGETVVQTS